MPTSLVRPGRPFSPGAERALHPLVISTAHSATKYADNVLILPEFPLPVGVPDLTAVRLDEQALAVRIASGVPPVLGRHRAAVLAKCGPTRPTSLITLSRTLGVSERQTRGLIGELVRSGALTTEGTGWCRSSAVLPLGKVFSFEAKVSDWRSGFAQCLRYGLHADNVTLILGRVGTKAARAAQEACRAEGVGLVIEETRLVRSRSHTVPLARRLETSEHLLELLVHQQTLRRPR